MQRVRTVLRRNRADAIAKPSRPRVKLRARRPGQIFDSGFSWQLRGVHQSAMKGIWEGNLRSLKVETAPEIAMRKNHDDEDRLSDRYGWSGLSRQPTDRWFDRVHST